MRKHVFLAGFMGAGKSKIGKLLSKEFSWPFYDTDDEIEKRAGKSVKEIFDNDGEPVFRKIESEAVSLLSENSIPSIIALGGGALMDENNFQRIKANGILVYIKSSPEQIYERIKHSSKRPLLQQDEKEKMLKRITDLLDKRSEVYEKADIVFNRDVLSLEDIVKNLYTEINECWDKEPFEE